jgi:phage baseplate assembly protein W
MSTYNGFSTVNAKSQKKFTLTGRNLIKQDLMNNLMTRRGQRLMQPNYGCIAWEKLFENLSPTDVNDIAANVSQIVNSDPRVAILSVDVSQSQNSITVTAMIQYVNTDQTDQLVLNYNTSLLESNS